MRFAIKTRPEHQTWEEIRDAWIAADEIPLFESAWNWDHFYPLTPPFTGPNFEAWTMLAAVSAHAIKANHGGSGAVSLIILPIVLVAIVCVQWGAISVARRNTTIRSDQ